MWKFTKILKHFNHIEKLIELFYYADSNRLCFVINNHPPSKEASLDTLTKFSDYCCFVVTLLALFLKIIVGFKQVVGAKVSLHILTISELRLYFWKFYTVIP